MVAGKVKAVMGLQKSPQRRSLKLRGGRRLPPSSVKEWELSPPTEGGCILSVIWGSTFPAPLLQAQDTKGNSCGRAVLEKEVAAKHDELEQLRQSAMGLEVEKRALQLEMEALQAKMRGKEEEELRKEGRMREMQTEIKELRRTVSEQQRELRRFSSGARGDRCQLVFSAVSRPNGRLREGSETPSIAISFLILQFFIVGYYSHHTWKAKRYTKPCSIPPIPAPPALPEVCGRKGQVVLLLLPPPPPPPSMAGKECEIGGGVRAARAGGCEFYHTLMRRDSRRILVPSGRRSCGSEHPKYDRRDRESIGSPAGCKSVAIATIQIKSDVETGVISHGFLIREVESAAFTHIEDLVAFVKWLDDELSFLVDERAVLKHFDWPEREPRTRCGGRVWVLRSAEAGVGGVVVPGRQAAALRYCSEEDTDFWKKHGVYNLSRVREGATERYKNFHIPWEWMLDGGLEELDQISLCEIVMKYMKRITSEIEAIAGGPEEGSYAAGR
ncbi:hypothetical protein HPP92_003629 [Vanilla planifolia]|uniref:Uncharacterized protein n=1 Tax=Vanilla planifolia TaxID=51239 RepID=A0A835VLN7_VANPL|nr:hypothetical protein HPP92_003629 [Vanilla planifolia]